MKIGIVLLMILFSTGAFGEELEVLQTTSKAWKKLANIESNISRLQNQLENINKEVGNVQSDMEKAGKEAYKAMDIITALKEKLRECENRQQ